MSARSAEMPVGRSPIRFRFDTHGLGDCVHAATVLQLYMRRGYDVAIQVEQNKRWLWQAMGIPIYDPSQHDGRVLPLHPYYYPDKFFDLSAADCANSKVAHFVSGVGSDVLPRLGPPKEIWREICDLQVNIAASVRAVAHDAARTFLNDLPRPIFAIHSRGTNWTSEKSVPDGTAFEAILGLLNKTAGSVVVLDFDARAPSVAGHPRCQTILPGWATIDLEGIAALLQEVDLLIGIDSGPFHLARLIPDCKSLGIFRQIPATRCCIPSPHATYLVPGRDHIHWQKRFDLHTMDPTEPAWNFIEYRGDEPTAQEIVDVAIEALLPPIVPPVATLAEFQQQVQAVPGYYLYRRMGHDERILELLSDGTMGLGGAGAERKWRLAPAASGLPSLTIYGDVNRETCQLSQKEDGIYRGRWNEHEKMLIELIPVSDVASGYDLWNQAQAIWPSDAAVETFTAYQAEWGLTVGTRGNGAAWLLDSRVQRSELDSCGIDAHGLLQPYVDHEDWIFSRLNTPAGSVCLDLASFVGTVAVWWAKRGSIVIACEPIPVHRDLLHKNICLNQVANRITVIPKAFGAMPGTARMWTENGAGAFTSSAGDIEVEVTTVDLELLPHLSRLDVIKLDVEGAECDVIAGARETIKRFRPRMIIEVHSHMDNRHDNGIILARQLTELGYTWRTIWKNTDAYYYVEAKYQE